MTSYAAQVEGMCAGQIDVGFFAPLQMTLLLGKACGTPVLAALRKDDTGALATTYKSQILVRTDSGINSIADLKGKKFAFVDPLSASGYVYPTLAIKTKTGQEPKTFFSSTIFAGGHPQAALAVYQGTVDGAAMFIDARDSLVAANPTIKTDTKVIDTAGPIPNDGVALRKGFPDDVGKTVKQALLDYSKDAGRRQGAQRALRLGRRPGHRRDVLRRDEGRRRTGRRGCRRPGEEHASSGSDTSTLTQQSSVRIKPLVDEEPPDVRRLFCFHTLSRCRRSSRSKT